MAGKMQMHDPLPSVHLKNAEIKSHSNESASGTKIFSLTKKSSNNLENSSSKSINCQIRPQINSDSIKDIIYPPVKTCLETLEENLYETIYHSSKNRPLGKRRTTKDLDSINSENKIFGLKTMKSENIKDIIAPSKDYSKTIEEELKEQKNHKRQCDQTSISKQIGRRYSNSFNKSSCFGKKLLCGDNRMQTIMKNIQEPSKHHIQQIAQIEKQERTNPSAGKGRKFGTINESLPTYTIFGKPGTKDKYGVKELLYQQDPLIKRNKILDSFVHISSIRRLLKKKDDFNIMFLYNDLQIADVNNTHYLPWSDVFNIIRNQNDVPLCKEKCEVLIDHFNLKNEDGLIDYFEFVNLINDIIPFPKLGKLDNDCYCNSKMWTTTYHDLANNVLIHNTKNTTSQLDSRKSIDLCKSEKDDIKSLLTPSIPIWFGLDHKDYLYPRSKEDIRRIFTNIGIDLSEDSYFNKLYAKALELYFSTDEKISVDAFKNILDQEKTRSNKKSN